MRDDNEETTGASSSLQISENETKDSRINKKDKKEWKKKKHVDGEVYTKAHPKKPCGTVEDREGTSPTMGRKYSKCLFVVCVRGIMRPRENMLIKSWLHYLARSIPLGLPPLYRIKGGGCAFIFSCLPEKMLLPSYVPMFVSGDPPLMYTFILEAKIKTLFWG